MLKSQQALQFKCYSFMSAECMHTAEKKVVYFLSYQTSNTQNASIQNVVQKCSESINAIMPLSFHEVGYANDFLARIISVSIGFAELLSN